MHNTEVKTEVIQNQEQQQQQQQQQQQIPHHNQPNVSHRRIPNGEGMVSSSSSSRHHREVGTTLAMTPSNSTNECAGCGKRITDRFLLKALDLFWHEDCLKCGCCDCRLGEVGSTLYTKANLILCKRDYLRLFGNTGYCAACSKVIPAFEMVMRARNNVYHLECFACQQCNHRFCVGDRFYLCENKILCEYDYEERMVFANMACSPGNLAILRRQVTTFQSGAQSEQQQQQQPPQQQQFHSSSGNLHGINVFDQFQQFDQQPKYTLPFPISKIPVSESLGTGSYSTPAATSPPPSSSNNPGPETGYITKQQQQPRVNLKEERTDPFFNVKCSPNLGASSLSSPPPAKRPKQSYPTFDTSDNLDSFSTIQYSERNNNNGNNGKTMQLFLPTPPNTFSPLFIQAVREAEDLLGPGVIRAQIQAQAANMNVKAAAAAAGANNNAMGSPDSGIVEGP